jgi:hypothetical protein
VSVDGNTRSMPVVPAAPAGRAPKGRAARRGGRRVGDAATSVSVAHHPRVAARVRAAKGWGAMGAFGLVALVSASAGAPTFDVLLRALVSGVVGWVVAWAAAVQIGRAIVRAEVEAHLKGIEERRAAEDEERPDRADGLR